MSVLSTSATVAAFAASALTALIVDDNELRREVHESFLKPMVGKILIAEDIDEAQAIITKNPLIHMAIVDINFDSTDSHNEDGLDFGRELVALQYPGYITACSAHYRDNETVLEEMKSVFSDVIPHDPQQEDYDKLVMNAIENSTEIVEKTYLKTMEVLDSSSSDIAPAIEFHKFDSIDQSALQDTYKEYVANGYRVILAEPELKGSKIGQTFILWSKDFEGGCLLEVFQVPELFAYGDTQEEALEMLSEVITGIYGDLHDLDITENGDNLIWNFVKNVYS